VIRATAITQARRAIREESDTGAAPAILSRPRVGIFPIEDHPAIPDLYGWASIRPIGEQEVLVSRD
jgi:hypothetical protein